MIPIGPRLLALALILPGSRPAALPTDSTVIFRGSLDERANLVFVALHAEMTAAYDAKTGVLIRAWKGNARPSAEMARGPGVLYRTQGPDYHRQNRLAVWRVAEGTHSLDVKPEFLRVIPLNGHVTVETRLRLPQGRKIAVVEIPEFDDHYGDNALRRHFSITGIPRGCTVRLWLSGEGMKEHWAGGGAGRLEQAPDGQWQLVQSQDGDTPLKVTWSDYDSSKLPVSVP